MGIHAVNYHRAKKIQAKAKAAFDVALAAQYGSRDKAPASRFAYFDSDWNADTLKAAKDLEVADAEAHKMWGATIVNGDSAMTHLEAARERKEEAHLAFNAALVKQYGEQAAETSWNPYRPDWNEETILAGDIFQRAVQTYMIRLSEEKLRMAGETSDSDWEDEMAQREREHYQNGFDKE